MSAKRKLEQKAIYLQKLAYEILSDESFKIASIPTGVDAGIFDKDLNTIITVLYTQGNLAGDSIRMLHKIAEELQSREYKLPSYFRRYNKIKTDTEGNFNSEKIKGSNIALDGPLRRLYEKLHELQIFEETMAPVGTGSSMSGSRLLELLGLLISHVKRLDTAGSAYQVSDDNARAGIRRTDFLDARYDQIGAALSKQIGSHPNDKEHSIEVLHVKPLQHSEWKNDSYAVHNKDFPALMDMLSKAVPDFKVEYSEYSISELVAPYSMKLVVEEGEDKPSFVHFMKSLDTTGLNSGTDVDSGVDKDGNRYTFTYGWLESGDPGKLNEAMEAVNSRFRVEITRENTHSSSETEEEYAALQDYGSKEDIVKLITFPFGPDQVDDSFPTLEMSKQDEGVGPGVSKYVLTEISRSRFAGLVEFDEDYSMSLLWANASPDDQLDEVGRTYRDNLVGLLGSYRTKFEDILGQTPSVQKTETGASLYFTQPMSIPKLVNSKNGIITLVKKINKVISAMESRTGLGKVFNKSVSNSELPYKPERGN